MGRAGGSRLGVGTERPAMVAADTTAMALHTHLSAPVIRMRESVGFDPEGGAARDEAWSPSAPSF